MRVRTEPSVQLECNGVIKLKITEWSHLVAKVGTKQFRSTLTVYVNPKIAFQSASIKQFPLFESLGIQLRVRTEPSVQLECNGVIKSKITEWSHLVAKVGTKIIASPTAFGRPAGRGRGFRWEYTL